jgi:hypothetical protein
LAARRLVDPLKVAAWAEMFAKGQSKDFAPEIRELVAQGLNGVAIARRSMATKPAGGGKGAALGQSAVRAGPFLGNRVGRSPHRQGL